jgi:hypothetical protein
MYRSRRGLGGLSDPLESRQSQGGTSAPTPENSNNPLPRPNIGEQGYISNAYDPPNQDEKENF